MSSVLQLVNVDRYVLCNVFKRTSKSESRSQGAPGDNINAPPSFGGAGPVIFGGAALGAVLVAAEFRVFDGERHW